MKKTNKQETDNLFSNKIQHLLVLLWTSADSMSSSSKSFFHSLGQLEMILLRMKPSDNEGKEVEVKYD